MPLSVKSVTYKKVLLRERKRHTARRVASARYADLSGGGTPSQVRGGGTPTHVWEGRVLRPMSEGGTPSQVWGGIPSQVWGGVLHPRSRGVPHSRSRGGYPIPGQGERVPHPDLVKRGTPGTPPPCSGPGMGYPPARLGWGTPPQPDLGWSTPQPDLGWGTPRLPRKCGQLHRLVSKHYLPSYYVNGR